MFAGQPAHGVARLSQASCGCDCHHVGIVLCRSQIHALTDRAYPGLHIGDLAERIVCSGAIRPDRSCHDLTADR
jgi:hypothetical protein